MIGVHVSRIFRWIIAAFPLLFPLYLLKFSITFGGTEIPFTVLEAATYLLFIVFTITEIGELQREENPKSIVKGFFKNLVRVKGKNHWNAITVPIILLVIASAVGVFISEDTRLALGIFKGWIFAPLLYFAMWSSVTDDPSFVRKSLHFYLFSAFLLAIWALNQVYTGEFLTIDQRASGPFESANYLAMYLSPAVAVHLVFLIKKFSKKISLKGAEMWLLLIEFVATSLALYFSFSYSAMIAVAAAAFAYFVLRYGVSLIPYWRRIFLAGSIGVLLLLGLVFLGQGDSHKFKNFLVFDRQTSSSVRVELWTVAGNFIVQNPVIGIGPGQYQQMYKNNASRILGKDPYDPAVLHPHSIYLSFWLYTGFLGLCAFGWIVMSCFVRLRYCVPFLRPYMRIGLVMLLVILVHGFFDNTFWKNDLAYLFWFVVGLSRI